MPEPTYRGEPWLQARIRADIASAAAERERRAEADRARRRSAARAAPPAPMTDAADPVPAAPARRERRPLGWQSLDNPHRYALAESRHS